MTKSVSNQLCSKLHNDNIHLQVALAAAEIIISSHTALPIELALDFFDIDKNEFLEVVSNFMLNEYRTSKI